MSPDLDETLFEALRKELSGRRIHTTQVQHVKITRGVDADGNPALFVRLTLTDPPHGAATWPSDDVLKLRRLVREAVLPMLQDDAVPWYVSFDTEAAEITSDTE